MVWGIEEVMAFTGLSRKRVTRLLVANPQLLITERKKGQTFLVSKKRLIEFLGGEENEETL